MERMEQSGWREIAGELVVGKEARVVRRIAHLLVSENEFVAVKILNAIPTEDEHLGRCIEGAAVQRIIDTARTSSSPGRHHVIRFRHIFQFQSHIGWHICIISDAAAAALPAHYRCTDIYDHMPDHLPPDLAPIERVKRTIRDVLLALDFLHTDCGIIHGGIGCFPQRRSMLKLVQTFGRKMFSCSTRKPIRS